VLLPPWLRALRLPLWSLLVIGVVALVGLHAVDRWFDRREDTAVREAKAFLEGARPYRLRMEELLAALDLHEWKAQEHRDTARAKVAKVKTAPPLPPPPPGCERWTSSLAGQVAELAGAAVAYEAAAAEDSLALVAARAAIATADARRDSAETHLATVVKATRPARLWLEVGGEAELPKVWDEPMIRAGVGLRIRHDLVVGVHRHQEVTGARRGFVTIEARKSFRLY
jgi:hypothetical protein